MKKRKKRYLRCDFEELIGKTLYETINELNKEKNLIFVVKKTKGTNLKFNQNKSKPIVVRLKRIDKLTTEIVVTYY